MTVDATSSVCNLALLDSLSGDSIKEILQSWNGFCLATEALLKGKGDLSFGSELASHAQTLCKHGLQGLVEEHFLHSMEEIFEKNGASKFWHRFEAYRNVAALEMSKESIQEDEVQQELCKALEEISLEKQYQEKCLHILVHAAQLYKDNPSGGRHNSNTESTRMFSKYRLMVSSVLMNTLPRHFPDILHWYFKRRLEELSTSIAGESGNDDVLVENDDMDLDEKSKLASNNGDMDVDGSYPQRKLLENNKLVKNIGMVVHDLRSIGFTSMAEDAYASAVFLLLKAKVYDLAGDDFRSSVLQSIKVWIEVDHVP